jgi:cell division initiation protein
MTRLGWGLPQALSRTVMNVSPLDLRQARLSTALRGFDRIEVTSLLMAAADDYEDALRETDRLRQEVTRMEAVLDEYRKHENSLKSTLMTAQKLADDMALNAKAEADRILRDAHRRSEALLEKSQSRYEDVQREIDGLRLKRQDVETSIEATIQSLRHTLEFVREQDHRDREERAQKFAHPREDDVTRLDRGDVLAQATSILSRAKSSELRRA